jgi:hypothetical protein
MAGGVVGDGVWVAAGASVGGVVGGEGEVKGVVGDMLVVAASAVGRAAGVGTITGVASHAVNNRRPRQIIIVLFEKRDPC